MQTHSERIADILRANGVRFFANDAIGHMLTTSDLEGIEEDVRAAVEALLKALVIDTENDHNTRETAARVARMYVREVFAGRYKARPSVTDFPNAKALDQIYALGPITVRSACSHHLVPIIGQAWIGVIPSDRVVGISKFARLTEWVMARPQIQEEAAMQLAEEIEAIIKPVGLAVIVKATHMCMTWRGIRETNTAMTTSVMRGTFAHDAAAKAEFLRIIEGMGY